ncbi:toll/interleukin-1 receptor domain-containing protein, partial [Streptomyces beijiangensis]
MRAEQDDEQSAHFLAEVAAGSSRFSGRTFAHLRLAGQELGGLTFTDCSFRDCVLGGAKLDRAVFLDCRFSKINGIGASFTGARFERCTIEEAAFRRADFYLAGFVDCTMAAEFEESFFVRAEFTRTKLTYCNFAKAHLGFTCFVDSWVIFTNFDDVRQVGLNTIDEATVAHSYAATVRALEMTAAQPGYEGSRQRLLKATRSLTRLFLDSGVNPDMVHTATQGTDMEHTEFKPSAFISYSAVDEQFATALAEHLLIFGVQTWFAPHDMKGGRTILEQVTQAISEKSKVILVLSEASMASAWV